MKFALRRRRVVAERSVDEPHRDVTDGAALMILFAMT